MILSLTNGLKPLKSAISQKRNLAKLLNRYGKIYNDIKRREYG